MRFVSRPAACAAAIIGMLLPSLATAKAYDCQLTPPRVLNETDGNVTLDTIEFPQLKSEHWRLKVKLSPAGDEEPGIAQVIWPSDPIQLVGKFPYLPTAKGAVAFTSFSGAPCMFTVAACLSLVQIADQGNGKADILIQPSALGTNDRTGISKPFVAVIKGSCTIEGSK